MKRFEKIDLATARGMSKSKLTVELGKRKKFLENELGVDPGISANFIAGILNMGVAMQEILDSEKER